MSTFDASKDQFNQYHFSVVEIDLPVVLGVTDLTDSIIDAAPEWYWKLDELTGTVAVDVMNNGNLEYETFANAVGYAIQPSSSDGVGSAKDISGDSTLQIYDPTTTSPITAPADVKAWYKLDETSGTTFTDEGGGNALTGAVLDANATGFGDGGTGIEFDGVTALYYGTNGFSSTSVTVSAWIETTSITNAGITQIHDRAISGASAYSGHYLRLDTAGKVRFFISDNTGHISGDYSTLISSASVNDGAYHHIVATYDGTTMKIYIDGVLDNSMTSSIVLTHIGGRVTIGSLYTAYVGFAYDFFTGIIDDVRHYERAITITEVGDMYSDRNAGGAFDIGSLTTSDFTIEGAFYISTATLNMHFLGKMDNTVEYAIRLDSTDSNILKFDLFQSDNTDRSTTIVPSLSAAGVTADGAWHWLSIRMSYTGTSFLSCEIDSVLRSATDVSAWSGNWRQDVLSRFAIGADGKDGTNIWDGAVDEVGIYLKAITDIQRSDNYNWWSTSVNAGSIDGFGTPYSSSAVSNGTGTYKFCTSDAPELTESGILRIVDGISETTPKLTPQAGLASRGGGTITMIDIKGEPNPYAPAVTAEIAATGTYLAKLDARNIMVNKPLRIKNYRMEADGSIDLVNGAQTRNYIIESFNSLGNDKWALKFKDELSRVNIGETVFPLPLEGSLRTDIDASTTTIPVDAIVTYIVGDTIRIGDELMKVSAVANIGTGTASLTVGTRGSDIVYTNTLSETNADTHEADDEVFVCDVSDDEDIDIFLQRVLVDVGVDASFINAVDWAAEILDWHPTTKINTLWIESEDTNDILKTVLGSFLLDMWFDTVDQEIKLTAISQWKVSDITITEGVEIDYDTVKRKKEERLRYTRGLVVYDKRNLTDDDNVSSYNKATLFKRTDLEVADLYGEAKTKRFDFSRLLTPTSAALLVNRHISRNTNPLSYKWITQERKLNFDIGDVLNIVTDADVGFSGSAASGTRAQITEIRPKYNKLGREYSISALSYQAAFDTGEEIIISGNVRNLNIHTYVGAPNEAVELTIIFDGATVGSTDTETAAIVAGNFAAGSKLIFILANGADLCSKGGTGGEGQNVWVGYTFTLGWAKDGKQGGIVYDAQGVDTDIYFSGATASATYATADGYLRAPNGGDGGFDAIAGTGTVVWVMGICGDGGDGIDGGFGGSFGDVSLWVNPVYLGVGADGANGGYPTAWGQVGAANNANAGGLAGSGVIDSGATVTFYGDTAARYVDGNGDH